MDYDVLHMKQVHTDTEISSKVIVCLGEDMRSKCRPLDLLVYLN